MEPFDFIVVENPTAADAALGAKPVVIVQPTTFMSVDYPTACVDAERGIPAEKRGLSRELIDVHVRPFSGHFESSLVRAGMHTFDDAPTRTR